MLFDATGVKVRTNAEWAADKQHSDLLQTGGRQGYSRNIYDPNVTLREAIQNERLNESNASQARVLVAQKYGQGSMNDLNKLYSVALGKPEVQYDSSTGTWCTINGVSGEKFASFDSKKAAEHALKEWDDQSQEDQPMDGKEDRYSKELIPTAEQASMGRRAESGYQEGLGAAFKTAKAIGVKRTAAAVGRMASDSGAGKALSSAGKTVASKGRSAGAAMAAHPKSTMAAAGVGGAAAGGLAVNKLKKQESWRDPYIEELLKEANMKRKPGSQGAQMGPEISPNSSTSGSQVGYKANANMNRGSGPQQASVGPEIPDLPSKKSSIGLGGGPEQKSAVGHATSKNTAVPFSKTGFKPGKPTSFLPKPPMSLGKKAGLAAAGGLAIGAAGTALMMGRRKKEGEEGEELFYDEDGEIRGDEELLEAYLREKSWDTARAQVDAAMAKDHQRVGKSASVDFKRPFGPSSPYVGPEIANLPHGLSGLNVPNQTGPVGHKTIPAAGKPGGIGAAGKGMAGLLALGFTALAIKKAHDAYKEEHGEAPSEEELHHQLKKDQD